eukprot:gene2568-3182_t
MMEQVNMEIQLHKQLKTLDCIGFDMDMTIVGYNHHNLAKLVFECLIEFLLPTYPEFKDCELDFDFSHRGVVVDVNTGYILKLDHRKRVFKAFDGDDQLPLDKIDETYHNETIPESNPLHSFTGMNNQRFFALISFFEVPVASIWRHYTRIIKKKSTESGEPVTANHYQRFIQQLLTGFNLHFTNYNEGRYFKEFRENTGKFVYKASEKCINWLKDLRKTAKVLLITNSKSEYTHLLMTYCYGENFQELFDMVVTHAKKPDFFTKEQPFYLLPSFFPSPNEKNTVANKLSFNHTDIYQGGNVQAIIKEIRNQLGRSENDTISFCYVGDHLIGDVQVPKQHLKWMTIAIVDEIGYQDEVVILKKRSQSSQLPQSDQQQLGSPSTPPLKSKYEWGSFFHVHDTHTDLKIDTFWSSIIRDNADIVLSSIETLAEYFYQDKFDNESLSPCAIIYDSQLN